MKKLLSSRKSLVLTCLGFILGLSTCKDRDVDPFLDGKPRILSVTFPSIPAQDVSIDQKNFIIYVNLPATMTVSDLTPTVVVKDSAKVIELKGFSVPGLLCQRGEGVQLEIPLAWRIIPNKSTTPLTQYKIKFLSTGPLTIMPVTQPFSLILGYESKINIPCQNLYGNPLPIRVRITHLTTGDTASVSSPSLISCGPVNHFRVSFAQVRLRPGSYRIDVQYADRSFVTVSHPLIMQKGPAELVDDNLIYFGYKAAAGKTFTANGINLFDGDIELKLIDNQDREILIPDRNLQFEPYGRQLAIQVPSGSPAGQYVLQLWQYKKLTPTCYRLRIIADENNSLIFGIIGGETYPCSIKSPIIVPREQEVLLTHTEAATSPSRLKLISLANSSEIYYLPIKAFSHSTPTAPPSVTIPITVPAGRYIGSVQALGTTTGNVLRESEPYGRIIELQ